MREIIIGVLGIAGFSTGIYATMSGPADNVYKMSADQAEQRLVSADIAKGTEPFGDFAVTVGRSGTNNVQWTTSKKAQKQLRCTAVIGVLSPNRTTVDTGCDQEADETAQIAFKQFVHEILTSAPDAATAAKTDKNKNKISEKSDGYANHGDRIRAGARRQAALSEGGVVDSGYSDDGYDDGEAYYTGGDSYTNGSNINDDWGDSYD